MNVENMLYFSIVFYIALILLSFKTKDRFYFLSLLASTTLSVLYSWVIYNDKTRWLIEPTWYFAAGAGFGMTGIITACVIIIRTGFKQI
ncbi:hypothetical protein WH357_21450 [Enterobacter ludwigii]